eukprot:9500905-Pyramimonas_sp.AAC.1
MAAAERGTICPKSLSSKEHRTHDPGGRSEGGGGGGGLPSPSTGRSVWTSAPFLRRRRRTRGTSTAVGAGMSNLPPSQSCPAPAHQPFASGPCSRTASPRPRLMSETSSATCRLLLNATTFLTPGG